MWKGNVARTERIGKTLDIIISYTNGFVSFDETITTDRPQNDTWLVEQITNRLNQLNGLDLYEQSIKASDTVKSSDISIDPATGVLVQATPDPVIPVK